MLETTRNTPLLAGIASAALGFPFAVSVVHAQEAVQANPPEEEQRLAPVVITAGGFEQDLEQAPASISVVTREELERREVTSLADALRGIEGVNVRSLDARSGKTGNQTISLRGLPEEYTLVLIDGVRQNVSGTVAPNAFTDTSSVFIPPVAAIERIEVIRGPMSTLYGSDAIGGVVNIITRKPDDEWEGSATLGHTFQSDSDFGGYSTLEGYLAGPLVDQRLSMQLYTRLYERSASSIDIPGTEPSLTDNRTMGQNPTSANVETFGGRLLFTPNAQDEFSLRLDTTRQSYDNSRGQLGRLTGTGDSREDFLRGYSRELEFQRDQVRLGHRGDYDFGTWETTLTQDRVETLGRTINEGAVPDSSREGAPRTLRLDTTILDTQVVTYLDDHVLTVGGQYLRPKLEDGILPDSLSFWQYSLFVEDEWFMTDRFTLTGGLRFDDNENFSSQITPRLYGVFSATDTVTLKGGIGQGFRAPYIEQISDGVIGYGDGGSTPLFGNPDLEPERSTNVEFTVAYDNRQDFSAQATVFRNELKDKIERGTGANEGIDVNIGESVVRGVELATRYRFAPNWAFSANYTWTDSEVKRGGTAASNVGDPLASVPEHMLNARLDWQATPRVEAFAEAEYRSSAFRPRNYHEPQDGGSAQGAYDALGDFHGFTMVNVGAAYHISENVTLNATIYNLFDKDFKDYRPYTREDTGETTFSNVYNNLYEPRRLFVSLNARF
ncbi:MULTISPECIES: TonB-dependent receptor domain-containing protein [unclassified Thioalkalivibrio]|uniref:TonB-dependent receptor domain-containing protein n=1 Tax=unclassified Thioalkalivibrio TaxID=2621013 RepID=UPI00036C974E|nr:MULTISPECIES: TonB-dependent receptor [unclassified Thioalkalivibrio]